MARSSSMPKTSRLPISAAGGMVSSRRRAKASIGRLPVTIQYITPASA